MIEGVTVPGLARMPVAISGSWYSPSRRLWEGRATAEQPIVAVAFVRCEQHVEWGLSWRFDEPDLKTAVSFSGHEDGAFVQVVFGISGGGARWTSTLPSHTYRPAIPAAATVETGTVSLLARIGGTPAIDLMGLFIAKGDTKGGRKHIWHIRTCFRDTLPPLLRRPLTYGRSGFFEDQECAPLAGAL